MKDEKENFDKKTANEATTNEINNSDTITLNNGEQVSREEYESTIATWATFKDIDDEIYDDGIIEDYAIMASKGYLRSIFSENYNDPLIFINEKEEHKRIPATRDFIFAYGGEVDIVLKENFLANIIDYQMTHDLEWKYDTIEDALASDKKNMEAYEEEKKANPQFTKEDMPYDDQPQGWKATDFDEFNKTRIIYQIEEGNHVAVYALKKSVWEKYRKY